MLRGQKKRSALMEKLRGIKGRRNMENHPNSRNLDFFNVFWKALPGSYTPLQSLISAWPCSFLGVLFPSLLEPSLGDSVYSLCPIMFQLVTMTVQRGPIGLDWWAGETTQLASALLCKCKDLSSIPRVHLKLDAVAHAYDPRTPITR